MVSLGLEGKEEENVRLLVIADGTKARRRTVGVHVLALADVHARRLEEERRLRYIVIDGSGGMIGGCR